MAPLIAGQHMIVVMAAVGILAVEIALAAAAVILKVRHARRRLNRELDAIVRAVYARAWEAGAEVGFVIGYRAGKADGDGGTVLPLRPRRPRRAS